LATVLSASRRSTAYRLTLFLCFLVALIATFLTICCCQTPLPRATHRSCTPLLLLISDFCCSCLVLLYRRCERNSIRVCWLFVFHSFISLHFASLCAFLSRPLRAFIRRKKKLQRLGQQRHHHYHHLTNTPHTYTSSLDKHDKKAVTELCLSLFVCALS
jgi:hypothetical protein